MRVITFIVTAAVIRVSAPVPRGQGTPRTLVAVWAHADDEAPVGPVLAPYAREGVQVHMIIATDGAQGAANTSVPRGPEIAKLRVEESAMFRSGLGDMSPDPARVPRWCARKLQRGPADAVPAVLRPVERPGVGHGE